MDDRGEFRRPTDRYVMFGGIMGLLIGGLVGAHFGGAPGFVIGDIVGGAGGALLVMWLRRSAKQKGS